MAEAEVPCPARARCRPGNQTGGGRGAGASRGCGGSPGEARRGRCVVRYVRGRARPVGGTGDGGVGAARDTIQRRCGARASSNRTRTTKSNKNKNTVCTVRQGKERCSRPMGATKKECGCVRSEDAVITSGRGWVAVAVREAAGARHTGTGRDWTGRDWTGRVLHARARARRPRQAGGRAGCHGQCHANARRESNESPPAAPRRALVPTRSGPPRLLISRGRGAHLPGPGGGVFHMREESVRARDRDRERGRAPSCNALSRSMVFSRMATYRTHAYLPDTGPYSDGKIRTAKRKKRPLRKIMGVPSRIGGLLAGAGTPVGWPPLAAARRRLQ